MKTFALTIKGEPDHEDTVEAHSHEEATVIFTSRLNKNNPDTWTTGDVAKHVEEA